MNGDKGADKLDGRFLEQLFAVIESRKGGDTGELLHRPAARQGPRQDRQEDRRGGGRGGGGGTRRRPRASWRPKAPTCSITCWCCGRRAASSRATSGRSWPSARASPAWSRRRRAQEHLKPLTGRASSDGLRRQQRLRQDPARRDPVQQGLRGRLRARLPRHPAAGAGARAGHPEGPLRNRSTT